MGGTTGLAGVAAVRARGGAPIRDPLRKPALSGRRVARSELPGSGASGLPTFTELARDVPIGGRPHTARPRDAHGRSALRRLGCPDRRRGRFRQRRRRHVRALRLPHSATAHAVRVTCSGVPLSVAPGLIERFASGRQPDGVRFSSRWTKRRFCRPAFTTRTERVWIVLGRCNRRNRPVQPATCNLPKPFGRSTLPRPAPRVAAPTGSPAPAACRPGRSSWGRFGSGPLGHCGRHTAAHTRLTKVARFIDTTQVLEAGN